MGLFSSPSGARAALLNASGLGAGYFYLRQWLFFAIALVVTIGLLVTAAVMGVADNLLLWVPILLAWFAVAAVHGLFAGRSHDERALTRGAQPPKGFLPFLAAGGLVLALIVSLTGVWQTGEWRLRVADAAHARGECGQSEAVAAYESVEDFFQLSLSPSLMDRARSGIEACEILERAQGDVNAEEYEQALSSYGTYFEHPASRWVDSDGEVADIHLSYAGDLAATADEAFTGEVTEDYRESMRRAHEIYNVIPVDYEGTAAAGEVPAALVGLYEIGTGEYAAENWCAGFDQIEVFHDLDWESTPEITERIGEERPDAALNCGWAQADAGEYEDAEERADFLTDEYPDYEADDVEALVRHVGADRIEAEMDTAILLGESDLDISPYSTGNGDKVSFEFVNHTDEEMRFLYLGPDAVHGEVIIEPCADCDTSSPPADRSCLSDANAMDLELAPGEYRIVIGSTQGMFDRPLHGTLGTKAGETYADCFYRE